MGILFQLLIYGLLAGGAIFGVMKAWDGVTNYRYVAGASEQLAKDTEKLDASNEAAKAATARADNSDQDAANAKATVDKQNAALAEANARAEEAAKAARINGQKYALELAKNAQRDAKLRAAAAASPRGGQTCEALLSATDAILRESLRAQMEGTP